MFIYFISDRNKVFKYDSKFYKTPCKIKVKNIREIDRLNEILKQNNIIDIKVSKKENFVKIKQKSSKGINTGLISILNIND